MKNGALFFQQEEQETCLTSTSQIYCTALPQNAIYLPSKEGSTTFSVLNTPPETYCPSWPKFKATTCLVSSKINNFILSNTKHQVISIFFVCFSEPSMYLPVAPIMSKHRKSLNLLDVPQHNASLHTKASLNTPALLPIRIMIFCVNYRSNFHYTVNDQ